MAAPATGPYPEMTLTTPGGNPASLMSSHILKAERGVCSAVLRTRVHPQARAGAISEENERDGERRDRIQRVLLKSEVLSFSQSSKFNNKYSLQANIKIGKFHGMIIWVREKWE